MDGDNHKREMNFEDPMRYHDPELERLIVILNRVPYEELPILLTEQDMMKVFNYLMDLQLYYHLAGRLSDMMG